MFHKAYFMRERLPHGSRKITCSRCGKEKEAGRQKQRYCKACHNQSMHEWRVRKAEIKMAEKFI
jgi:hypothetical protein